MSSTKNKNYLQNVQSDSLDYFECWGITPAFKVTQFYGS